jgi:hypothetical protein
MNLKLMQNITAKFDEVALQIAIKKNLFKKNSTSLFQIKSFQIFHKTLGIGINYMHMVTIIFKYEDKLLCEY